MSYYVASTAVDVFPFSKDRGTFGSKVFSEHNILKITKNYLSNESYVISYNISSNKEFTCEFVLDGYYFKITDFDLSVATDKSLFAVAYVDPITNQLIGSDTDEGFTGLQLVPQISSAISPVANVNVPDSEKQAIKQITLQLLNGKHEVPLSSKPGVVGVIDGGVIE